MGRALRIGESGLFVDQYELTMAEAYLAEGLAELPATFSLFVRRLPSRRSYLLAAGLDEVLAWLEAWRFTEADLSYLASLRTFSPAFLGWLARLRFEGDVRAMPEGTPFFADEPVLEVDAPLAQAQLVETCVMNLVHAQTVLATKASRVVRAAGGRPVVDFGARRGHGAEGLLHATRALYLGGISATSLVAAGAAHGIPIAGTMAHSFVQAFERERDAFRAFVRHFPETTLLVDTYDTLEGVRRTIALARELGAAFRVRAVRLDSGELGALATAARALLDEAGLDHVRIFASGGLDEHQVRRLVDEGRPIDAFGVGTALGVSDDAPKLDMAYKLVERAGGAVMKLSAGKRTLPGRKQVFRRQIGGRASGDVIARDGEALEGRPLLRAVMRAGRRLEAGRDTLEAARARARDELALLPEEVLALDRAEPPYPVALSAALQAELERVAREVGRR